MRAGRKSWESKVGKATLERIREAVRGGDPWRAIYDRFNVQQWGVKPRTFRGWHAVERRDWEMRRADEPAPPVESAAELLNSLANSVQIALDAGRMPDKKLPDVIHAIAALERVALAREASQRAEESHAAKMAEYRKRQDAALSETAVQAQLTDEQVAEIRTRVLGL